MKANKDDCTYIKEHYTFKSSVLGVLPQRLHILVLHILEACTTCLSPSLFVPNLFFLQFTLTRPCLYQTLTYLCLNFTQHKCTLPHMYQTQMYTVLNIPNLYLPNLPHCFSSWAEFSIFDFSILNFTFWGLERLRVPALTTLGCRFIGEFEYVRLGQVTLIDSL